MIQDPFADIPLAAPPPQQGPTRRVIQGPPRQPAPRYADEEEAARLRIQLDRERLARERAEREVADARRPGQIRAAEDPAGDAGVDQRRMAGFYSRAARSNTKYERTAVAPRGVVGQTLADTFPRLGNVSASTERQMAEASAADFIAATLRYESGAAIPPAELEAQGRRYFPQPGDSPETIALKASLRADAIEGLRQSAGQAANGIELGADPAASTALSAAQGVSDALLPNNLMREPAQAIDPNTVPPSPASPGAPPPPPDTLTRGGGLPPATELERSANAGSNVLGTGGDVPLSPEEIALERRLAGQGTALARSGRSADQIDAWLRSLGRQPLTSDQRALVERLRASGQSRRHPGYAPSLQSRPKRPEEVVGEVIANPNGAGTAFAANAADAVSLGLPGLFSEDYRNRLGDIRQAQPIPSIAGAIAGGILAPGGPRPGMSLGAQSLRTGGQGAAYGFNSSGGDPVNALVGGTIGAAAPGAFNLAGRGATRAYNALARPANVVDDEARAIAQALADENIPGSRPLVDSSVRDRMAYLEASPGTGNRIREGLGATRTGLQNRADELQGPGVVQERPVMGQRVQDAGLRYRNQSRTPLQRDYDRAAQLADGIPVYGREVVAELDDQLTNLRRNPSNNKALIQYLESVRSDFVDAEGNLIAKSVGDVRDIRTNLNANINTRNLTRTNAERLVNRALDRGRRDIDRDLNSIHSLNPTSESAQRARAAWETYRRADVGWGLRARELKQVVERLTGPADNPYSGGQVMNNIRTMLAGDPARAERMLNKLNASERADLTATVATSLGRNAPDEPFSIPLFMRNTRAVPETSRKLLFGEDGARSISNLRTISQALRATEGRLNNSQSGKVMNWRAGIRDFVSGGPIGAGLGLLGGGSVFASGATGLALGASSTLIGAGLRNLSARTLMNKDMSRWLAAAPRATTPTAIRRHIDRLQLVARSNPAISQEITGLRSALMNAVNDNASNMSRAAADSGPAGGDDR